MEVLQTPPQANSFTPLAEHQSRTPQSFYGGTPILYYHSTRCKVVVLESELVRSPALRTLRGAASDTNGLSASGGGAAHETTDEKEIVVDGVDIWVASDKFFLYRTDAGAGVAIPYPLISLHAIQRLHLPGTAESAEPVQGLYMQIANPIPSDNNTGVEEDEEEDSINLTIVPPPVADAVNAALSSYHAGTETTALASEEIAAEQGADTKPEETATQALFAAVSACSNLHPDPVTHGDEADGYDVSEQPGVGGLLQAGLIVPGASDGGLPPPVNGSSGWITADNIHEYFDEEGNWIGEGEPPSLPGLGPGAGNVHDRDDGGHENGEGNQDDETKWRRTD